MLQVLENRKDLEYESGDSLNASPKTVRWNQKLVSQAQKQFTRVTRANLRKRSDTTKKYAEYLSFVALVIFNELCQNACNRTSCALKE